MNGSARKVALWLLLLFCWGAFSPFAASAADGEKAPFSAVPAVVEAESSAPLPPGGAEEDPAGEPSGEASTEPPGEGPAGEKEPPVDLTEDTEPPAEEPVEPSGEAPAEPPADDGLSGEAPVPPAEREPEFSVPLPDGAFGCGSAAELRELVNERGAAHIVLTADIVWERGGDSFSILKPRKPTLVEMGGHVIEIPGGSSMEVSGPVRFEGSGGRPLITVSGSFSGEEVEIAASGEGAAALCVESGASWIADWMELSAEGPDAVAVWLKDAELRELNYFSAAARGEGAVAIRADGPLKLLCCSAVSDGESVVCGGGLLLDACRTEPFPEGAETVGRHAVPAERIEQIGYSVVEGTPWGQVSLDLSLEPGVPRTSEYFLYDSEGRASTLGVRVSVLTEGIPVDCSTAGVHELACRPVGVPDWFPVEIPPYTVPLHVVPPDAPWIENAYLTSAGDLHLAFLTPIAGAERIAVQYLADGDETWRDAAALPHFELLPGDEAGTMASADLGGLEIDHRYYFRLVVEGGAFEGISNALEFPYASGDPTQLGGGDRDDDGRGEQGGLPPIGVVQPPSGGGSGGPDGARERPSSEPAGSRSTTLVQSSPPEPGAEAAPRRPAGADVSLTPSELAAQRTANPEGITLIGQGLRVTLPAALLDALPADAVFYAQLEKPGEDRFLVRFWSGEEALAGFGGLAFRVTVDYAPADENAAFFCTGPDGRERPADGWEDGRLRFELETAGAYLISERPGQAEGRAASDSPDVPAGVPSADGASPAVEAAVPSKAGAAPVGLAAALCAALAGGAFLYLRRRKGGDRRGG